MATIAPAPRRRTVIGRLLTSQKPRRAHTSDYYAILWIVMALSLFGLLMVLSASSVTALYEHGSSWYEVGRQVMWFLLALLALFGMQRLDYHRLSTHVTTAVWIALGLMVLPLMPVIGISVNGASRWFGFGMLRIQPSEIAKLVMIVFAADLLTRRELRVHDWQSVVVPIMGVFGAFAILLMAEPNLGTTIILATILLVMMFVGGVRAVPLLSIGGILAGLAAMFAIAVPWRMRRLLSYTDPWNDPSGIGLQSIQSRIGIATGGLRGLGLGASRVKWWFLPEADTDFIFAIVGEELGFIGCVVVVALLLGLGVFGIRTAMRATDRFGMLLAVGITTWILLQAFVNIGAVVGALPITGVPLPFISAGGSSLIFTMIGVGILLSVANRDT
jgi:cell division protein FtsW